MSFEHLLAKSHKADQLPWPEQLLSGHLREVVLAAEQLVDATGHDQLNALGLNAGEHFSRFRQLARLAAALHDIGKANDHFQEMLRKKREIQGLRHEWVSLLMVRERLMDWLTSKIPAEDIELALWAVVGHHPKYGREVPPKAAVDGAGSELTILWNHAEIATCLRVIQDAFELPQSPVFEKKEVVSLIGSNRVFTRFLKWQIESVTKWSKEDKVVRAILAALKNTLVGADVAGSALPSRVFHIQERRMWIGNAFANRPSSAALEAVVAARLKGNSPREFQNRIGESSASITLVTAGCGSGKTVGAYLWAARQHPGKRLYFCYPTTGTATEGYRGYLHIQEAENLSGEEEAIRRLNAELFHSRRKIDFEVILQTESDEETNEARIEALDAWHTPVVACTCDTVLGVIQNNRKGQFAWPAVAGSAIVFDEIHSYDDRLFGALLRFLQNAPGIPLLLMTASLPKGRLELLNNVAVKCGRPLNSIKGPPDVETLLRYRLENTPPDIARRVREELELKGKVLWVSNTVNRVIDSANLIPDLDPKVYHSRYKYGDRVQRHKEVVDAFDPEKTYGSAIACGSQVAEMSLDLKGCTLLVTDLAPVHAMIQRLGRLNRDAKPDSPVRPFIVVEPEQPLPYSDEELKEARVWLSGLAGRDLNQRDLVEQWSKTDRSSEPKMIASAWFDGGPSTMVIELREESVGVTVLLASDKQIIENETKDHALFTIPMPTPPRGVDWKTIRHKGIPVVTDDTIEYDPKRGARWQK